MLGCQDFCGYYDWTFHHVRRQHGHQAVAALWRDAIGGESQRHYTDAARRAGLKGLLEVWTATGVDERCDWTFTLDEAHNTLRWDMRQCPSRGFLIRNNLVGDEDYCDHCAGWIAPMLRDVGIELVRHEHNHCGQCWSELSVACRPAQPLDLPTDIRRDERWQTGYIDRFNNGVKLPLEQYRSADPCEVIGEWFRQYPDRTVLASDASYVARTDINPAGILIGDGSHLHRVAERFHATEPTRRPLLMHAYLPAIQPLRFAMFALPRPVPILPLLLRHGLYHHDQENAQPAINVLLRMIARALGPVELLP